MGLSPHFRLMILVNGWRLSRRSVAALVRFERFSPLLQS
jgi:hypothetical protein